MVDIWWLGHACFRIKGKNTTVVIDPYAADFVGLSPIKTEGDIVCVTHEHKDHSEVDVVKKAEGKPFVISGPGEYEISGVNIVGVSSYHDEKEGTERGKNVIFQITIDGINIVHLGDLGQKKLSQAQLEEISCDVLMIPTGGLFTIEAKDAPDIIAQLEPKIIIPMHYKEPGLKFDLAPVDDFLKAMGKEKTEEMPKLSVSADKLPEEPEIVVFSKT